MTMWEVFTCGRVPYAGVHVMGLLKELQRGETIFSVLFVWSIQS